MVGESCEEVVIEAEGVGEDAGERVGNAGRFGIVGLHAVLERVEIRPHVEAVVVLGQVQAGKGPGFGAHVERLEKSFMRDDDSTPRLSDSDSLLGGE